jgi:ATP-dependent RNA helicase DeaD
MKFIKKFTQADITKQRVPERQEIVDLRKKKVEADIEKMLSQKETEGYRGWAKDLLEGSHGEDLITALLKYSFGKDLEDHPGSDGKKAGRQRVPDWKRGEKTTKKLESKPSPPQADIRTTRLSIAMGKKEKMNKGRIVEMINQKAGTHPEKITNIEIMDDFTFITVPAKEAKSILKFFRRSLKGKQPLVMKVKVDHHEGPKIVKKRSRKEKGRFVRP